MFFLLFCLGCFLYTAFLNRFVGRRMTKLVEFQRDKVSPVCLVPLGNDFYNYGRYQFSEFSGLGDEPVWGGSLPYGVVDFSEPRYVYEDLFESETPVEGHGWVIGYRISPTLVIHSMVGGNRCWGFAEAYAFAQTYRGHFLEREEVNILRRKWSKVSQMREAIGDVALPTAWFWAKEDGMEMVPAHYRSRRWSFIPEKCNVIMKR